jgi:chromatin remodeling complex protein RSC6
MEQTVVEQMQVQHMQIQEVQVQEQSCNGIELQQQPNNLAEPPPAPTIESQFNSLLSDLTVFKTYLSDIQSKVRLLEKTVKSEIKNEQKNKIKQERIKKVQQPSGFDKPIVVSDELCLFMNKPLKSLIGRTDATNYITNYIRHHKLQDMLDRKIIKPNEALNALLHLSPSSEPLTYFNLQKYLNVHFNGAHFTGEHFTGEQNEVVKN